MRTSWGPVSLASAEGEERKGTNPNEQQYEALERLEVPDLRFIEKCG